MRSDGNKSAGIIGAGNMGSLLAEYLAYAGYTVELAHATGRPVAEVVKAKSLVVVALPMNSVSQLPEELFTHIDPDAIVIDTCNYFPEIRDLRITEIEEGLTESEWVARQLSLPVIKAFNNITALSLGTLAAAAGSPGRICLSVAGDNQEHKIKVCELMDIFGFDSLDAGKLCDSWRQQPGAPAYCRDLGKAGLRKALQNALPSQVTVYREQILQGARAAVAEAGSLADAVAKTGRPEHVNFVKP